ncbi:MAG TPA: NAD(P)-dependent oxidoreductase [Holophagaceae bacterium]
MLEYAQTGLTSLREGRLLVTGGTGFFGTWLLESLCLAHDRFGLGVKLDVLSRDPAQFLRRSPHLAGHPALRWRTGDIRNLPPLGEYTHVLHGATAASAALNDGSPEEMVATIVEGTRSLLAALEDAPPRRLLYVSSGAVYGTQPSDLDRIPETHPGGPDPMDPRSAYAEGKRLAEHMAVLWTSRRSVDLVVARPFAFVGPHLPLDAHFAMGNFLADALAKRPIQVKGDGTPLRSYLHAADLAVWIWTLLALGRPGQAYNVGSESALSIADLARCIGRIEGLPVQVARTPVPGAPAARYVPSTAKARQELGLRESIPLEDALRRTLAWHREIRFPGEAS